MCVCVRGGWLTEGCAQIWWQQHCSAVETTKLSCIIITSSQTFFVEENKEFRIQTNVENFKQSGLNFLFLCSSFPGAPHSNSSSSLQTGASLFSASKDGMHQRSFSVSSADQWNEAINTSTSSGARKTSTFYIPIP